MPPKFGRTRLSQVNKRVEYLGVSRELPEDDLPTLRRSLQFILLLREQALLREEEPDMAMITKEAYHRIASLYFKANAKFSQPVIMGEKVGVQKLNRALSDINSIVRKQKGFRNLESKIEPLLDKLLDLVHCQCLINCLELIPCSMVKCTHRKLMCCEKEFDCKLDNCPHKQVRVCVMEISCSKANCGHKKCVSCACPKEIKLPSLDLSYLRAQRLKVGDTCAYQMSYIDKKETREQNKSNQRKQDDFERQEQKYKDRCS